MSSMSSAPLNSALMFQPHVLALTDNVRETLRHRRTQSPTS